MKATKQLRDEHKGILEMLKILEKIYNNINEKKGIEIEELEKIIDLLNDK